MHRNTNMKSPVQFYRVSPLELAILQSKINLYYIHEHSHITQRFLSQLVFFLACRWKKYYCYKYA